MNRYLVDMSSGEPDVISASSCSIDRKSIDGKSLIPVAATDESSAAMIAKLVLSSNADELRTIQIGGMDYFAEDLGRFTLSVGKWYAAELIGEEFGTDIRSASAIKVLEVATEQTGSRAFDLHFYHANYPEGVRDKRYRLRTIERNRNFIFAMSLDHDPKRFMLIYRLDPAWMERNFDTKIPACESIEEWLNRNC